MTHIHKFCEQEEMNEQRTSQMFPESRGLLFVFSPILGLFLAAFAYYVHLWHPSTLTDKIGKALLLEALFTFITLCLVGFAASILGPDRIRPLIVRHGFKAAVSGVALIVGFGFVILYYGFTE